MKITIFFFMLSLLASLSSTGQIVSEHYYAKISVPDNQEYLIQTDSVYLDTLILGNNSKLKFLFSRTKMIVENALIGNYCIWDATGTSGENGTSNLPNGIDGGNGKDLVLIIVFRELKSLSIKTDGGKGGNGLTPNQRSSLLKGGNAGEGGDGGRLELHYSATGFLPRFNEKSEHSIFLSYKGGNAGLMGIGKKNSLQRQQVITKDYSASPEGRVVRHETPVSSESSGTDGHTGSSGLDGHLILKRFE
jgi:hypothetical protein